MADNNINYRTTSKDYNQNWYVDPNKVNTLKELVDNY
jgi:hypothetical protein